MMNPLQRMTSHPVPFEAGASADLGDPEVDQLDAPRQGDHDVGRLEVLVDDAVGVKPFHPW